MPEPKCTLCGSRAEHRTKVRTAREPLPRCRRHTNTQEPVGSPFRKA